MINNIELERLINLKLKSNDIADYCPNGLQVEGRSNINKLITGVTASQALLRAAAQKKADAILVHHGYFWKNESCSVRGIKKQRLTTLLTNNINLYAYHLPLDIHPTLGNNAQLAKLLNITCLEPLITADPCAVVQTGTLTSKLSVMELSERITNQLKRPPLVINCNNKKQIRQVAICTGGGQNYIELAASANMDAFISGEINEQTTHLAKELGIHYFAAGHHATERYGVQALGNWLRQQHQLTVEFVDIDNPA